MTLTLEFVFLIVVPLLLLEGLFSGSEIALLAADKLRLKAKAKKGSRGAELAVELSTHPERIFSATLLMTSLCVTSISAVITLFTLSHALPSADLIAVLISSPLVVLFGELIPKTVYQKYADLLAPRVSYPVSWAYWALLPLTHPLTAYTSRLSKLIGPLGEALTGKRQTTRDELRALLSYEHEKRETEIQSSEQKMIRRILDFKDTEAKQALIPLVNIDAIEAETTVREALEILGRHRHSRVPVYSERIPNIIGILDSYELFSATDLEQPIRNFMGSAQYVAETQDLHDLLKDMAREDNEIVVVVDEYGGAVGILTFEDIVEQIVGEISDEHGTRPASYQVLGSSTWLIEARMEIRRINEQLHLDLPEGDYETLSGFLLQQFGRIPEIRDELYFNTPSGVALKFTIRKANERQIESVLVERTREPA